MMEKNCAKKGVYEEIILSENNTRNYQSLSSYFTDQNKKCLKKKIKKAKESFDSSPSTETKNKNFGTKVCLDMLKSWETNNSLVSDSQQSCHKGTYSYRKLETYFTPK